MAWNFVGIFQGAERVGDFPCEFSLMAEAESVGAAFLDCTDMGFDAVQIESDSK